MQTNTKVNKTMGDSTGDSKQKEDKAQAELISKLHESLTKTKADYERLELDHAEIQNKFLEWENDHKSLIELNDRLARVNADAAELMIELEEKNQALSELNKRLVKTNAESASLMAELEEKNEVLLRTNHELARANAHAAELMAIIELKDEQIHDLNRSLSKANAMAAELVAERELRMDDLKGLNKELKEEVVERKRAEETIKKMAYHDDLTGLPNRRLLKDRMVMAMALANRHQKNIVVMLLDLDQFKQVNDTLGHSSGDKLLQAVGERLKSILRESDTVARMGGDEFTVLLPELSGNESANMVAQRILEILRKPFMIDNHELMISTSIGIAMYPNDGQDVDTLLKKADIAMYRAKANGRDNYQNYTKDLTTQDLTIAPS